MNRWRSSGASAPSNSRVFALGFVGLYVALFGLKLAGLPFTADQIVSQSVVFGIAGVALLGDGRAV